MAPKKNKQREKQEQNRASSSARAQESLFASFGGGGGGASGTGFIGFSSFAQSAAPAAAPSDKQHEYYPPAAPAAVVFYDGPDHDIAMALKMLGKKGTITKTKALSSLLTEILPPKKGVEVRGMVGHFVQVYTTEMRDQNDRKVRQLLNEVLRMLTDKLRPRAFAAYFKRLLPYWYMAMHDVNAEVATTARQAFDLLFPEVEVKLAVVEEHLSAIMEEYQTFLSKTVDTFEGMPMQPDECEERCDSQVLFLLD